MISPRAFLSLATCAVNSAAVPPPTFMPCLVRNSRTSAFASTLLSSEFSSASPAPPAFLCSPQGRDAQHVEARERLAGRWHVRKQGKSLPGGDRQILILPSLAMGISAVAAPITSGMCPPARSFTDADVPR